MTAPVKYLFDKSFDEQEEVTEPIEDIIKRELRAEFDIELKEEKKKSYEEGMQEGYQKAKTEIDQTILESNEQLKQSYDELNKFTVDLTGEIKLRSEQFNEKVKEHSAETVKLGLTIAKKISEESLRAFPLASLQEVFESNITKIPVEQKIFVSVPANLVETADGLIKKIASEHGVSAQVIIKADEEMPEGDWLLEWDTGGIARATDLIIQEVTNTIQKYIKLQLMDEQKGGFSHINEEKNQKEDVGKVEAEVMEVVQESE